MTWKKRLLAARSRSGEGALAVDKVMRFIATSIDCRMHQTRKIGCDDGHNAAGSVITAP
ncbi:MAG: hypothetical protein R3F54_12725 [Alphaproteobacteria bacterium]